MNLVFMILINEKCYLIGYDNICKVFVDYVWNNI